MRRAKRLLASLLLLSGALLEPPVIRAKEVPLDEAEELRAQLMGFADSFADAANEAMLTLRDTELDARDRINVMRNRGLLLTSVFQIAAADRLDRALLDMVVVTSLTRRFWEDYWAPEVFGEAAAPWINDLDSLERRIWRIAGTVLTPDQVTELRAFIDTWYAGNRHRHSAYFLRFSDIGDRENLRSLAQVDTKGGLFGIKAAVSELDELLETLERTLWLLPKLQGLASMQAQQVVMESLAEPEMQTVVAATESFAASGESLAETAARAADTFERLPDVISTERRAILGALEGDGLGDAVASLRALVDASSGLADQADALLRLTDDFLQRGPWRNPKRESPIDPADLESLAAQIGEASARLESLAITLDGVMAADWWDERFPQMLAAMDHASDQSKEVVDHTFRRAVALIAIFMVMLLITMLAVRLLTRRLPGPLRVETRDTESEEQIR